MLRVLRNNEGVVLNKVGLLVACSVAISSFGVVKASDAEAGYRKRHYGSHRSAAVERLHDAPERGGRSLQAGMASWSGPGFQGRKTASGERFNTNELTAAHRFLPFGTRVLVVNQSTRRSVVVRINDRGPFHGGRVIDLSRASAAAIGMGGTARVQLVAL
jgi:rare lipoprotein A